VPERILEVLALNTDDELVSVKYCVVYTDCGVGVLCIVEHPCEMIG
jgi:hypothetical protein